MSSKKKEFPKNIRITKLYADGYKGLKDFEIDFSASACWLLAGKNGSGKTRVGEILEIFHKIGAGETETAILWFLMAETLGNISLRIEGSIDENIFSYEIENNQEAGDNLQEVLYFQRKAIFKRDGNKITENGKTEIHSISNERLAFPQRAGNDVFRKIIDFLKRISVLRPVPQHLIPEVLGLRFSAVKDIFDYAQDSPSIEAWHRSLIERNPSWAKENISPSLQVVRTREDLKLTENLQKIWPDLEKILSFETRGKYFLQCFFKKMEKRPIALFELSDGERIFFMTALLMAELETLGPRICYWDEPENFLAPSEIATQLLSLQSAFQKAGGQLIVTSHNPLAMKNFSADEMIYLKRDSHDESPKALPVTAMGYDYGDDFRDAYIHDRLNDGS